jgi:hypothetical protein
MSSWFQSILGSSKSSYNPEIKGLLGSEGRTTENLVRDLNNKIRTIFSYNDKLLDTKFSDKRGISIQHGITFDKSGYYHTNAILKMCDLMLKIKLGLLEFPNSSYPQLRKIIQTHIEKLLIIEKLLGDNQFYMRHFPSIQDIDRIEGQEKSDLIEEIKDRIREIDTVHRPISKISVDNIHETRQRIMNLTLDKLYAEKVEEDAKAEKDRQLAEEKRQLEEAERQRLELERLRASPEYINRQRLLELTIQRINLAAKQAVEEQKRAIQRAESSERERMEEEEKESERERQAQIDRLAAEAAAAERLQQQIEEQLAAAEAAAAEAAAAAEEAARAEAEAAEAAAEAAAAAERLAQELHEAARAEEREIQDALLQVREFQEREQSTHEARLVGSKNKDEGAMTELNGPNKNIKEELPNQGNIFVFQEYIQDNPNPRTDCQQILLDLAKMKVSTNDNEIRKCPICLADIVESFGLDPKGSTVNQPIISYASHPTYIDIHDECFKQLIKSSNRRCPNTRQNYGTDITRFFLVTLNNNDPSASLCVEYTYDGLKTQLGLQPSMSSSASSSGSGYRTGYYNSYSIDRGGSKRRRTSKLRKRKTSKLRKTKKRKPSNSKKKRKPSNGNKKIIRKSYKKKK